MNKRKEKQTSYAGRHAELYDTIYQDKPYKKEVRFVDRCIKKFGSGRSRLILELACGTGTHALEFERSGYKVVAVDYSDDMLARAREKALKKSSQVDFRLADMRNLPLTDGPFDVVVSLFDSVGYVQTNEGVRKVFAGVRESLREEGLFIFEFWHAPAMLLHYEPVRVKRWNISGGELLRISETKILHAEQIAEVTYSIFELDSDGTYSRLTETQRNRFFLVQEMAGLLAGAGLHPVKFFSGFSMSEEITGQTWHVVAVARRGRERCR